MHSIFNAGTRQNKDMRYNIPFIMLRAKKISRLSCKNRAWKQCLSGDLKVHVDLQIKQEDAYLREEHFKKNEIRSFLTVVFTYV